MKNSNKTAPSFARTAGKVLTILTLSSLLGGIAVKATHADERGRHEDGRREEEIRRDEEARRRAEEIRRAEEARREQERLAEERRLQQIPVYAPAPVVVVPPPSPGITLVLPISFH